VAFAPTLSSPGVGNTYIVDWETSGRLAVEYARNEKDWNVNKYTATRKTATMEGRYMFISPDNAMRQLSTTGANFVWNDGADRPNPHDNNAEFSWLPFMCERYAPSASIGNLAKNQSDYDWNAHYGRQLGQQCVLMRANKAITLLNDSTQYPSDHVFTQTTAGGGLVNGSNTTSTNYIKRAFQYVARAFALKTGGATRYEDLVAVMSPATAIELASSPEVSTVLIQSQFAQDYLNSKNYKYGLPDQLFGIKIVVEDAPVVTSKKGAATVTRAFIMPDNVIFFVMRPGSQLGSNDFATVTFWVYTEMQFQTFDDPKHERTEYSCVDNYGTTLTSPLTSAKMTNVYS
jgi:hypothetical protein